MVPGNFKCLEEHMLSNFLVCFALNVFEQSKKKKKKKEEK